MKMAPLKTWITNGTASPFYARKCLQVGNGVKSATAYVCGLGQFNFYINGEKVESRILDPAWSDYRKIVYYVKFDVTKYLYAGENCIGAEVGNGWFIADDSVGYFFHFPEFMPQNPNPYQPFAKELMLTVHVDIDYEDGRCEQIDTGSDWEVAPHPVIHSNCYGSEVIDGRCKIVHWAQATAPAVPGEEREAEAPGEEKATSPWQPAKIAAEGAQFTPLLREQTMPPIKVIHTYPGKYLETRFGKSIYDFGQNTSGMLHFYVRGKKGEKVTAYPAEKLTPEGDVDQLAKNWMMIDVKEEYIIAQDDTWEEFATTFTYIGARYVGIDKDPEDIRAIHLNAISSATADAGSFTCSNDKLMQIRDLVKAAIEANMLSVHTDCPTIERFAWQEENHLMAPSVMFLKDVKLHWEKFLTDTRLSQLTAEDYFHDLHHGRYYPGEGLIPSQAPCYIPNVLPVPGMGDFYNIIGWGSSIILGTYWHYLYYGDEQIIRENYEAGKKYFAFLQTMVNADGFINHGLGDWGNPTGDYARENVETAFYYADAVKLMEFAQILGQSDDAEHFRDVAGEIKAHYNSQLLAFDQASGRYGYRVFEKRESEKTTGSLYMTPASLAMPLYFGLVPNERIEDIVWQLARIIRDAGCIKAGEVSHPYILQTMADHGMNELIYELIQKPEHPSYYAFVLAGETSLGEYWEDNPRSHNHDMMGHIIEWFYRGIAGIRPLAPGFQKVSIRPWMPDDLEHFTCSYETKYGTIIVDGTKVHGEPVYDIRVPEEIEVI